MKQKRKKMKIRSFSTVFSILLLFISMSLIAQQKVIYCDVYIVNNKRVVEEPLTFTIYNEYVVVCIPNLVTYDSWEPYNVHILKGSKEKVSGETVFFFTGELDNGSPVFLALTEFFIEVYLEETKTHILYRVDQLRMNSKNG